MVLAHERHHRRTGRGDVTLVGVGLEQIGEGARHEVGAKGHLVDGGKAQLASHGDQLGLVNVGELGRKAGRDDGRHHVARVEQVEGALDLAKGLLGIL